MRFSVHRYVAVAAPKHASSQQFLLVNAYRYGNLNSEFEEQQMKPVLKKSSTVNSEPEVITRKKVFNKIFRGYSDSVIAIFSGVTTLIFAPACN